MRLHWMIHGVHHDHPNDPLRLVMPPSASVPLAAVVLGAFWLVLGCRRGARRSAGASSSGYLAYDMLHYHVHHHTPRTALGHKLRELHMRHHFQDDERGFGSARRTGDRVLELPPTRPATGRSARPLRRLRANSPADSATPLRVRHGTQASRPSCRCGILGRW